MRRSSLLRPLTQNDDAQFSLFLFPYAGAGASVFKPWVPFVPESIQVVAMQMPGREDRLFEPPFDEATTAAEAVAREFADVLDRPYALFGHSLGALLAWSVAASLRRQRCPLPSHLFVSACPGPARLQGGQAHLMSDADLIGVLREFPGTPEPVLANREFMELLLPTLRADCRMFETFAPPADTLVGCPVSAFGGRSDAGVNEADLLAWSEITRGPFGMHLFEGGHCLPTV